MTLAIGSKQTPIEIQIPIKMDADGVARVGGTRVTLDSVIAAYEQEHSAEGVVEQFDVLTLPDVHYVIGFYLGHRSEVEAYLREQERQFAIARADIEAQEGTQEELRARLLARRDTAKNKQAS